MSPRLIIAGLLVAAAVAGILLGVVFGGGANCDTDTACGCTLDCLEPAP